MPLLRSKAVGSYTTADISAPDRITTSSSSLELKKIKHTREKQKVNIPGYSLTATRKLTRKIDLQRKKIQLSNEDLSSMTFLNGGVNKDKNLNSGVLYAKTKTGQQDFIKEEGLALYCEDKPDLKSIVSLQTKEGLPEDPVQSGKYATFAVYNNGIKTSMLSDVLASGLSIEQCQSLARQLVDILKTLYVNKVSHNDLHKENILVLQEKDQKTMLMKIIDFGRAQTDKEFEKVRFKDIDYVFLCKGNSALETVARNVLVPSMASMHYKPAVAIKQKHRPLHSIIKTCRNTNTNIETPLNNIGMQLKGALMMNPDNVRAFDDAKEAVCQLISQAFGNVEQ
ncbi:protein kinase domain-containing protein [Grimontia hollisae]|uniref:Protein kinase domain n=1 Tax=Grimontia hollisae TaxID=673 RepID=A0A377J8Q6_GRIHO|nr:hypothetical protein [Grimontia hollisae]STO98186.1 Protein kinase domain [Grimontia hollisae]